MGRYGLVMAALGFSTVCLLLTPQPNRATLGGSTRHCHPQPLLSSLKTIRRRCLTFPPKKYPKKLAQFPGSGDRQFSHNFIPKILGFGVRRV